LLDLGKQGPEAVIRHVTGLRDADLRDQSSSVLLPPAQEQRVMIVGGGRTVDGMHVPSSNKADVIDFRRPDVRYAPAASLRTIRSPLTPARSPAPPAGAGGGAGRPDPAPAPAAELYAPRRDCWTWGARSTVPRLYHSIGLLLPDGRVLTAGSNPVAND